jgi:hypothetical protein
VNVREVLPHEVNQRSANDDRGQRPYRKTIAPQQVLHQVMIDEMEFGPMKIPKFRSKDGGDAERQDLACRSQVNFVAYLTRSIWPA